MKSLLQINTNVGWNSTGRIAEDIGRCAISRGWLSTIAYGRNVNGSPSSASNLVRIGNDCDILMHGVATRLFDSHGRASSKATRNLIKRIEEISPDIIHLHNIHGYYLNYQELFAYLGRAKVPVVWTLHDCWAFTGHCAYFEMADCQRWIDGCHDCPLKNIYPGSVLCDRSSSNYTLKKEVFTSLDNLHIVTVSSWLKKMVDRSFLNRYPNYVIYNGIDVPDNGHKPTAREKLVLGAASKWDVNKGIEYFVELRKRLPLDYRMVLIGLSASQIRSLPSGIEGLRRINERRVLNDWFSRASVFVNPSQSETLSVANLEAQACGTPVVSFNRGGMSETITPKTGILVEAGDIYRLALAVRSVVERPSSFVPEDCRAHVGREFSKHINYNRYVDLYESIYAARNAVIPDLDVKQNDSATSGDLIKKGR